MHGVCYCGSCLSQAYIELERKSFPPGTLGLSEEFCEFHVAKVKLVYRMIICSWMCRWML